MVVLTSKLKIKKVLKRTSAAWFSERKVGEIFELHYNINGFHMHAPTIDIYQDGKKVHSNTAQQLKSNLKKFEIETI